VAANLHRIPNIAIFISSITCPWGSCDSAAEAIERLIHAAAETENAKNYRTNIKTDDKQIIRHRLTWNLSLEHDRESRHSRTAAHAKDSCRTHASTTRATAIGAKLYSASPGALLGSSRHVDHEARRRIGKLNGLYRIAKRARKSDTPNNRGENTSRPRGASSDSRKRNTVRRPPIAIEVESRQH